MNSMRTCCFYKMGDVKEIVDAVTSKLDVKPEFRVAAGIPCSVAGYSSIGNGLTLKNVISLSDSKLDVGRKGLCKGCNEVSHERLLENYETRAEDVREHVKKYKGDEFHIRGKLVSSCRGIYEWRALKRFEGLNDEKVNGLTLEIRLGIERQKANEPYFMWLDINRGHNDSYGYRVRLEAEKGDKEIKEKTEKYSEGFKPELESALNFFDKELSMVRVFAKGRIVV